MKPSARIVLLFFGVVLSLGATRAAFAEASVPWLRDETAAFARARAEHRFVLLYLEAVWCHWCHVMDHETYANDAVRNVIDKHYVPLRIDQDSRPDLANRYRDYGWPATIVFDAGGQEIVKRQGYQPAERFLRLLNAIVTDPSPENVASKSAAEKPETSSSGLSVDTRNELEARHRRTDDAELGGLALAQKFLDRDTVEYALARADAGDAGEAAVARRTLDGARALFDPVWGGVYQYSTDGDWRHPHYEKLATIQADYLRIYALAWASFHRDADKAAVAEIRRYVDAFLRDPDGGYYVSQDADLKPGEHSDDYFALDDAARRQRGVPRIDTHRYTQQTAAVAEALATWAEVSGDASALAEARKAMAWIAAQRRSGGGYRHDAKDASGPYLADTLAVGRAALALYRADADRRWLKRSSDAADFIEAHFRGKSGGYVGAVASGPIPPAAQIDENLSLARYANLLAHYTGKPAHRAMAEHALAWLGAPSIALSRATEAGLLLADAEVSEEPRHLVVVGAKKDASAKTLFSTLQQLPGWYKRIEWWDRAAGPLPHADVEYPKSKRAAAFVCTSNRCSLPLYSADQVKEFLVESAKDR